ncbi:hypothetical protein DYB26_010705 [Aphanomyces astaci]|uniref:DUF7769 domain-containing protein n=1 Tax=Aphanomyces astaci TaxID=112090 RepID=A0A397EPZ2_APHAT|nr:hypothetical protein DYB31_011072 [Aphanomyces astaci]RHZ09659.1 hypothetical protein DYB26_010705 [Aphanomyces astaci]
MQQEVLRTVDASVAVRDLVDVRKHLSFAHRRTAYETLLSVAFDGVLPRGALTELAQMFRCHPRTISRLWTQARLSLRGGHCAADVASKTKGNSLKPGILLIYEVVHFKGTLDAMCSEQAMKLKLPSETCHKCNGRLTLSVGRVWNPHDDDL